MSIKMCVDVVMSFFQMDVKEAVDTYILNTKVVRVINPKRTWGGGVETPPVRFSVDNF